MKKILIIRFSSIGDLVLTTPVIRCVKNKYPNAEIHFLTKPVFHPVLAGNPYISKFYLWEEKGKNTLPRLQDENYDCIIDLHKNMRTLKVKLALKKPSFSFDKINFHKWMKVHLKVHLLPEKHIVDRYFDGLKKLSIENEGDGLDYFLWEHELTDFSFPHHGDYMAFAIGANHATKRLPDSKIIEICKSIDKKIILLGGKDEKEKGDYIAASAGAHCLNYCGILNINQSAYVIKNALSVIAHDTGLMHIAAAFKKPVISVWGSTVPAFGMYPYYGEKFMEEEKKSVRVEVENLSCRPCSKLGFEACPKKHFRCMNDMDTARIISSLSV